MTPPPYFDRLAPAYHTLERLTFGGLLHWCRTAQLDHLHDCRRALILGDGDGRFLADLLQANSNIEVDSLDISATMIALAQGRLTHIPHVAKRARFILADARVDSLSSSGYDLVVTNFFLDCFRPDEVANLVRRVAGTCASHALWVDGDFRLPALGWARPLARGLLATMYGFFCLTARLPARELIDPTPYLVAEGFTLTHEVSRLRGFLSSRLWVRGA